MSLGKITGTIDRRILVNFRIDPEVCQKVLPSPFRPQLVDGWAIGGICMIRFKELRPSWVPAALGIFSENAAHRFAVEWEVDGVTKIGVYIPRRDTNSRLKQLVGGRLFPGHHGHADFEVEEVHPNYTVQFKSADDSVHVKVKGKVVPELPDDSAFNSLDHATDFFRDGSLGYSKDPGKEHFDGVELGLEDWNLEILEIDEVKTSFFDDQEKFPEGSIHLDSAYLMKDAEHEWYVRGPLCGDVSKDKD